MSVLRNAQKSKGQSLVEWAIILPFLLLITFAIVEMAPLMNNFLKIEKAAQYGAREGAIHGHTNQEIFEAVLFNMQGMTDVNAFVGGSKSLPGQNATSYVYEERVDGHVRTTIEITPGELDKRINGGWVMVRITYMHEIYTPLIQQVLNASNGNVLEEGKYFPVTRYAIYRIE